MGSIRQDCSLSALLYFSAPLQLDGARGPELAHGLKAEEKEPQFQGEAFESQRQRLQMVQLQTGRAANSGVPWDERSDPCLSALETERVRDQLC